MSLVEALKAREMSARQLILKSGVSAPTVYHITSRSYKPAKTGIKTETLTKIAQVLNAVIVIDESKPYYFDIFLK